MAKANKVKLPFVVEPRRQPIPELIGSEESGQFEIMRRGYLTVAEKSFVQQAVTGDEAVMQLQQLATEIGNAGGIEPSEVILRLGRGDLGDEIFSGYEERLNQVMAAMQLLDARKKVAAISALMLFRISEEWTIDETMALHPDIVDGLYALYLEEDSQSLDAFEALEQSGQETGK